MINPCSGEVEELTGMARPALLTVCSSMAMPTVICPPASGQAACAELPHKPGVLLQLCLRGRLLPWGCGERARRAPAAVRQHPAPLVIGVGGAGCIAGGRAARVVRDEVSPKTSALSQGWVSSPRPSSAWCSGARGRGRGAAPCSQAPA